jgi:hypothetical protein
MKLVKTTQSLWGLFICAISVSTMSAAQSSSNKVGHRSADPRYKDGILTVQDRTKRVWALELSPEISDQECKDMDISVVTASGRKVSCKQISPPVAKLRFRFDEAILAAANEQGIDPAQLKAHLQAESSFNPAAESPGGDKGIAQFDKSTAHLYGLDFNAPKPSKIDDAFIKDNCQEANRKNGLLSIWCPGASISAMAKYLRELQDRKVEVKVQQGDSSQLILDVSGLYQNDPLEKLRYVAGMYNRGSMPLNSIREHFRQSGKLPSSYEAAWRTPRINALGSNSGPDSEERDRLAQLIGPTMKSKDFPLLYFENKNRCYVELIVGVCGKRARGYYAEFSKDFKKVDKKWIRA